MEAPWGGATVSPLTPPPAPGFSMSAGLLTQSASPHPLPRHLLQPWPVADVASGSREENLSR